jgi:ABC-type nitrate/sulfonate/bicarbonate transport system permease component
MRLRSTSARTLLPLAGVIGLLAAWAIGAMVVASSNPHPERVLPSIGYVFGTSLPDIGKVGTISTGADAIAAPSYSHAAAVLWEASVVTLRRVLVGIAIGTLFGVGLGLLVSQSGLARRVLYPTINAIRQIPLLALTLIFAVWFGGQERGIVAFIAFGVGTLLFISTVNAIRNVPRPHLDFARVLGAGRLRVIRTVVVPAMAPEVLAGLKVAAGLAWAMALAAEFLGTQSGLGRLMLLFEGFGFTGRMLVVLLTLVLWALALHVVLSVLTARVTRWMSTPRPT